MSAQTQTENQFGVGDVIERLGVQVLTQGEAAEAATRTSTALAEFRAAPTIKAIGRDLARVASFTSDNREGARRRWLDRLVMTRDSDGNPTDMPLIVNVSFSGERKVVSGVADVGVGATIDLKGIGPVEVQPLFTVGITYIGLSDGIFVPLRKFTGVLFAPSSDKKGGAYKFVPVDLADPMLIARWNGIVDQGVALATVHKDWPKIEPMPTSIGKSGQSLIELAPCYLIPKEFTRKGRGGKSFKVTVWRVATRFLKAVVLHPRCQDIPTEAIQANVAAISQGQPKTQRFIFACRETENSLEVLLRGRPGEAFVTDSVMTIEEVGEAMNPFDVLDTTEERFDAVKARAFVDRCLGMPINDGNPLYKKAVELGLVIPGQPNTVIRPQLRTLADEALKRAKSLWDEALEATWEALKRFSLPTIEACLASRTLAEVKTSLNQPEDAAAMWISSHITGEFTWRSPFFRTLREWMLNAAAKHDGYRDPVPVVVPAVVAEAEAPAAPVEETKATEPAAAPANGDATVAPAKKPRKPAKPRKSRAKADKATKPPQDRKSRGKRGTTASS